MSAISLTSAAQSPPTPIGLVRTALGHAFRPKRVTVLLGATLAMSLADLAMTLTYATSVGMMEVNPIARAVMSTGSPWMLTLWKVATAGLGLGILFYFRRLPKSEIASWLCFGVMTALTIHWIGFNKEVAACGDEYAALANCTDNPSWVLMANAQP
jgi:hypothetical protein